MTDAQVTAVFKFFSNGGQVEEATGGNSLRVEIQPDQPVPNNASHTWQAYAGTIQSSEYDGDDNVFRAFFDIGIADFGRKKFQIKVVVEDDGTEFEWGIFEQSITVNPNPSANPIPFPVQQTRTQVPCTSDMLLWVMIQNSSQSLGFKNYKEVMDVVLCGGGAPTEQDSGQPARQARGNSRPRFSNDVSRALGGLTQTEIQCLSGRRALPFNDTDAYQCLKVATEAFVQANVRAWDPEPSGSLVVQEDLNKLKAFCTVEPALDEVSEYSDYLIELLNNGAACKSIPYLANIRGTFSERITPESEDCKAVCLSASCKELLQEKLCNGLLIELIWSYWHEEGMLAQTWNAIGRRFQNVSRPNLPDPLASLEIDPLRPLNNFIWGYIQDEQHRLSVVRRAYEYDHHYGLRIQGRAVPDMTPADSRSKFLEAFHNLLQICSRFFRDDDDTQKISDAFPVLNALKDVHLILSQGAHNQFGDLPSTARQEMLIQQWLLARPEFAEYLPTRRMVRYPEDWMGRVDLMKSLQGWTDTSVIHFGRLATFGEQVLLSIRFGDWSFEELTADNAKNWAKFWRSAIQAYIHSYRAVTGVDLTATTVGAREANERDLLPSLHIRRQMQRQQSLPATARTTSPGVFSPNGTKPAARRVAEPSIRRS